MKKFSEQLHKKSQIVKLTVAEKRDIEERLRAYMEYHPLPAEMKQKKLNIKPVKTSGEFNFAYTTVAIPFRSIFKSITAFAVLALVLVPVMAERAMPGDVLYAIKVQVNEEVRSTLIFDSYQKVEWETERLNRRISEARLLASEGRLTEEVEAGVAEAVRTHTDNAKKEIEAMRVLDADEAAIASIALDSTLEAQSTALRGDGEDSGEEREGEVSEQIVNQIADVIDASRRETEVDNEKEALPSYAKLMARIEQNTTRIYELRTGLEKALSTEHLKDLDRRVEDLGRSVAEAMELASSSESEAQENLISVLQRTQKLIVYMTELDVSETVDIETIVPVMLTGAEKEAKRASSTSELNVKIRKIETALAAEGEEQGLEKAFVAYDKLLLSASSSASKDTSYEEFLLIAKDAHALADDVLQMFAAEEIILPKETVVEKATSSEKTTSTPESTEELEGEEVTSNEESVEDLEEESVSDNEDVVSSDDSVAEIASTSESLEGSLID